MFELTKSMLKIPLPWQLWLVLLVVTNFVTPLFFLSTPEAQATLGAFFLSLFTMTGIHRRLGYVRLLSAGHIFWVPLVIWFGVRLTETNLSTAFGIWLVTVTILNTISLVIDTVDVIRYFRGERAPLV